MINKSELYGLKMGREPDKMKIYVMWRFYGNYMERLWVYLKFSRNALKPIIIIYLFYYFIVIILRFYFFK